MASARLIGTAQAAGTIAPQLAQEIRQGQFIGDQHPGQPGGRRRFQRTGNKAAPGRIVGLFAGRHAARRVGGIQAPHIHRALQDGHPQAAAPIQVAHQEARAHRRQHAAAGAHGKGPALLVLRGGHQDLAFQQHQFPLAGGIAQVDGAAGVQFQQRAVRQGGGSRRVRPPPTPPGPVRPPTPSSGSHCGATGSAAPAARCARPRRGAGGAAARARPDAIAYGTSGAMGISHLLGETFAAEAKIKLRHIPFQGSTPAVTALLGGHTDIAVSAVGPAQAHIQAGGLRPLAVFSDKRLQAYPDVPTLRELGYAVGSPTIYGLMAPKGTPPQAIARLNAETRRFFDDPAVKTRLQELQLEPLPSSPETVAEWTARDSATWGPLIRQLGLNND
ncbi:hypothetical protein G6F31_014080 [Rhizopus arrhizus]|nr:hypothetical protein G6F31_014080 [Rhizopus arrhizus]